MAAVRALSAAGNAHTMPDAVIDGRSGRIGRMKGSAGPEYLTDADHVW
jgi:hypothetical protein